LGLEPEWIRLGLWHDRLLRWRSWNLIGL
jgi:hypothetical protein